MLMSKAMRCHYYFIVLGVRQPVFSAVTAGRKKVATVMMMIDITACVSSIVRSSFILFRLALPSPASTRTYPQISWPIDSGRVTENADKLLAGKNQRRKRRTIETDARLR